MTQLNGKQVKDASVADVKLIEQYVKANGTRAFTADQSMGNFNLKDVADPTLDHHAANKGWTNKQIDAIALGWKAVRVATVAALPANTRTGNVLTASANGALAAIDGVTLVLNDRVLVKDEATGANNGIYYVSAVGDASNPWTLTRTTDADIDAEVVAGKGVWVNEGTTNGDSGWRLTTDDVITLNTTALTFTQFTGLGQVTAGNRVDKTGSTLNVDAIVEVAFAATTRAAGGAFSEALPSTPSVAAEVEMYVNGQRQRYGSGHDFTVSGTTVTWESTADFDIDTTDEVSFRYERPF